MMQLSRISLAPDDTLPGSLQYEINLGAALHPEWPTSMGSSSQPACFSISFTAHRSGRYLNVGTVAPRAPQRSAAEHRKRSPGPQHARPPHGPSTPEPRPGAARAAVRSVVPVVYVDGTYSEGLDCPNSQEMDR